MYKHKLLHQLNKSIACDCQCLLWCTCKLNNNANNNDDNNKVNADTLLITIPQYSSKTNRQDFQNTATELIIKDIY